MTARIIMKLRVERSRLTSPGVLHLHLVHPLRPQLPPWTAGAHVDLRIPDGRVRQYSLCGDPADRSKYEIAIKREDSGRGGSIWAHENLHEGAIAHISAPRNNFGLAENASRHVLIAGGIGVTPFVSMACALSAADKDFVLHYCTRSSQDAPLLAELRSICGDRLKCWFSSCGIRFDPARDLRPCGDAHFYVCGPQRLVDAVRATLAECPGDHIHGEAFQATIDDNFKAEPFEAEIASTGQRLLVPADRSLLDVLREAGFVIPSSCELGVCGSCECGYRAGVVIHRDKSLPVSRRQDRLLPCVSRARVNVVLDL